MVVSHDDGSSRCEDRSLVDFSRMHQGSAQVALADFFASDELVPVVEVKAPERFSVEFLEGLEKAVGILSVHDLDWLAVVVGFPDKSDANAVALVLVTIKGLLLAA